MENETSLNIVAAAPLYNPNIPLVRISSNAKDVADNFGMVFPSVNVKFLLYVYRQFSQANYVILLKKSRSCAQFNATQK